MRDLLNYTVATLEDLKLEYSETLRIISAEPTASTRSSAVDLRTTMQWVAAAHLRIQELSLEALAATARTSAGTLATHTPPLTADPS